MINFTPTGMIPSRALSPHVPLAPREIIEEVLEARRYGIAIVHLHARDESEQPTWDKEIYREIIEGIRERDHQDENALVICVSTSGRTWPDLERRSLCLELNGRAKPEMASLTLSSLNFAKAASTNSPEMIQNLARKMKENSIKPELEVFDPGMINYAKYLHRKQLIEPPFYFNIILNNIAGTQSGLLDMGYMIHQLPPESYWAFGGLGSSQLKANVSAMLHGGGIRIGLEDNLYMDENGSQPASNSELLKRIVHIGDLIDRKPYAPSEARKILGLNKR